MTLALTIDYPKKIQEQTLELEQAKNQLAILQERSNNYENQIKYDHYNHHQLQQQQ